ncbi:MAG TPA: biliverdin-producing heme oxygenase [Gordonia sp. (in: high G+C Gram-positive bacteria)]|uniref:biliverdin-producing heme oxygenase n=1 Tax=unclassified Gordonia (in: high G+C Gram-positive bacteria) TaxID=2657482 RepID=UPI000F976E40|nr:MULTISPECIES: biliverdin-producing heme oxygenase [unclassified Gordonia (in: high G+C Gram-positive bacteria)]RTL06548.1 MAG: biliverdin-producing heme oxygenase [Acidimicrobiia bacterium]HNP58477.1 biliverdin-producing heme oxygenase [Gordonia sp. (in: high G+C Gram-positive bacteria)]HRC52193.1 biliverdin-producing heme oxygenase [Gordonia sp. (in: high G+C Gram-positive bacteria)]
MTIVAEESLAPAGRTSQVLREATARAHENAERSAFVADLMGGRLGVAAYARLVGQLVHVYRALEDTGARLTGDPVADAVLDDRLDRVPSLESDLAALGVDPAGEPMLPVTIDYVAAIEACDDDAVRYLAHHYTRYLGDLSGGQIIASRMRLHYGVPDEALAFYRFTGIDKLKRYKDGYRERLDALDLDRDALARLTTEAIGAFEFNQRLFTELEN